MQTHAQSLGEREKWKFDCFSNIFVFVNLLNIDKRKNSDSVEEKISKNMSKYVELAKLTTNYAKRMNRLSNQIFGEVVRPTTNRSMKVVKLFSELPVNKNPNWVDYYPRHSEIGWLMRNLRQYGLFRDEHMDFKEEIERQRVLKGKKPRMRRLPPKEK